MSPTTSIPVFRISVAIGVTSNSSDFSFQTVNGINDDAFLRLFAIRPDWNPSSASINDGGLVILPVGLIGIVTITLNRCRL
jgi:hypothetical protein